MKRFIYNCFNRIRYELQQIITPSHTQRPSMRGALKWLAAGGVYIQTVLDVGASNGCWSAECMEYFPNANYVLFEPQPVHSEALDVFKNSNNNNVIVIKKAVGASEGFTLFDAADPLGGALADTRGEHTIEVALTTIDAALLEFPVDAPYLLKLDTHGFEKSILEGSAGNLDKCAVLIIEAYNQKISKEAFLFWELCSYLAKKGFLPVDLVDVSHRTYDGSLWQMDIVFMKSTWNVFEYNEYS